MLQQLNGNMNKLQSVLCPEGNIMMNLQNVVSARPVTIQTGCLIIFLRMHDNIVKISTSADVSLKC